jgi:broad specificity phosphatase PhoE
MNTVAAELYVIRHAETSFPPEIVMGRSNETPVTRRGVRQSVNFGRYMLSQGIIPTHVWSSPAVRALETGTLALPAMGVDLTLVLDDDLQELYRGDWEGRARDEVFTPEVYAEQERLGKDFKVPGGESQNEVGDRMLAWADRNVLPDPTSDQPPRHFVFGHGQAMRCLASLLEGWSATKTTETPTANTAFSLFTKHTNGLWRLEYFAREPK